MLPLTTGLIVSEATLREVVRGCLRSFPVRLVLEQPTNFDSLQVKRLNLDLLIVESAPGGELIEELVKRLKMLSPESMIVVIHCGGDPQLILSAMRGGAEEIVIPPVLANLSAALERLLGKMTKRELASRPAGKVIGIVSAKGGCGATTVACHTAAELQRVTEHDVLLADFDLDSGMVEFLMKAKATYTILDALRNVHRLDHSYWKALIWSDRPRLDVIAAPSMKSGESPSPESLSEVFRLMRALYGWVVADLGRGLGPVTVSLLGDLDEVYIVTTPSLTALYQAKQMLLRLASMGYPQHRLRLVVNRTAERRVFTPEEIQSSLGIPVYVEIPELANIDDEYASAKPVNGNRPQLGMLARKMTGVREEKSKSRFSLFGARKQQIVELGI